MQHMMIPNCDLMGKPNPNPNPDLNLNPNCDLMRKEEMRKHAEANRTRFESYMKVALES